MRLGHVFLSRHALVILTFAALSFFAVTVRAENDEVVVQLSIKDHKFEPAEVSVPASKAIKLVVKNNDSSAEEVESKELSFEKVIAGNAEGVIRIKPLAKGTYKFYGEYHEDTAKGLITVQ